MTTLIYQTTPPFCHGWQRVHYWEVVISNITRRARAIDIIIIISIRRGLLSRLEWRWGRETIKARLAASDATDFGVHMTHFIRQIVKTTTKINIHVLKLIHDVSRRDIFLERGRKGRCRGGSRGRGYIRHLHIRLLYSQLCCTPSDRLLAYGTNDLEERRGWNGDVHVCEDVCDSWRKDELITYSCVLIAIYKRYYHV